MVASAPSSVLTVHLLSNHASLTPLAGFVLSCFILLSRWAKERSRNNPSPIPSAFLPSFPPPFYFHWIPSSDFHLRS
ncbi:hypothetical protein BO82DRAFT_15082 [Aspergillus uvarum CBS 121591]|uniref:Uncharacterized protein n=1 Tax=Aspergillus uvarum CBS 121591 TaxID=1448315 RepID=A0A319BT96_9EURO|nr:hypothetical protein BO82DRAFT_15082 [Aspergillus uvarum CBS 121591]PYH75691.1 hypothetical protein BO82DRAFT_15082 [Aspergillus uvarum CBS 121591]